MNSFLPLIEAFLALGLTMIVLTAGVSSLAGTWQRLRRSRAQGLRALLRCTFLLAVRNIPPPSGSGDTDSWAAFRAARDDRNALLRFVAEMGLQPAALADIAARAATAETADAAEQLQIDAYAGLLPELAPPTAAPDRAGPRRPISALVHAYRRWTTRAQSLDTLSDEEFRTRFTHSTVGAALKAADEAGFTARLDTLNGQFIAYGHAASEAFARDARVHSTLCAAALVLIANIDAFDLLENYLAQPMLRAAVISHYEQLAQGAPAAAPSAAPAATPTPGTPATPSQLDEVVRKAAEAARRLKDPATANRIEDEWRVARQSAQDVQAARNEAQQVIADATAGMPVGWDRYPYCAPKANDARCHRGAMTTLAAEPVQGSFLQRAGVFAAHIDLAATQDTSHFVRWLAGLILTVVMLGLGTPFWIQAVNGLMRARDLVRGGNNAGDGPNAPAATGPAGQAPART